MVARLIISGRRTLATARKLGVQQAPPPATKSSVKKQPPGTTKARKRRPVFRPCLPVELPIPSPADGCLLRIRLPIRMTNNNAGRGYSWYSSAKFRAECEQQLRAWGLTRKPFAVPVTVHVTRVLGPRERLWDSSSVLRGNWKEIEDSLVALGWFRNDSADWIRQTIPAQVSDRRQDGPAIELEIFS